MLYVWQQLRSRQRIYGFVNTAASTRTRRVVSSRHLIRAPPNATCLHIITQAPATALLWRQSTWPALAYLSR